jgi:hypothetical protein
MRLKSSLFSLVGSPMSRSTFHKVGADVACCPITRNTWKFVSTTKSPATARAATLLTIPHSLTAKINV